MSNRSGGPGPPLFSVFCFSKRPPARHPEVARPPTDPEIKKRRPEDSTHEQSRVIPYPSLIVCTWRASPALEVQHQLRSWDGVSVALCHRCISGYGIYATVAHI